MNKFPLSDFVNCICDLLEFCSWLNKTNVRSCILYWISHIVLRCSHSWVLDIRFPKLLKKCYKIRRRTVNGQINCILLTARSANRTVCFANTLTRTAQSRIGRTEETVVNELLRVGWVLARMSNSVVVYILQMCGRMLSQK